jgi:hypothetical protein
VIKRVILFFTLIFLVASTSFAEYRVYQYSIRTLLDKPHDNQSYIIISTLNPVTYQAYHGGSEAIHLDIVRSWMCMGNTGNGQEICKSPEEQLAQGVQ